MKKYLTLLVLGLFGQTHASDFVIDTERCAGTEFIRDQNNEVVEYDPVKHTFVDENTPVFYAGEQLLPFLWVSSTRSQHIVVTNTSNSIVSFFFKPTFYVNSQSGNLSSGPNTLSFGSAFSSSNDPLDGAGSTMQPRSSGRITYSLSSDLFNGHAAMAWDSSVCFDEPPMLTTTEHIFGSGSRGNTDIEYINNGQPW